MGEFPSKKHQFKKGHSGNPSGRPPGAGITDRLRKVLFADDGEVADRIVEVVKRACLDGDIRFIQEVWNRLEGKPVATIEGEVEKTVRVIHEHGSEDPGDAGLAEASDRVAELMAKRAGHNGRNGTAGRQNGSGGRKGS